MRKGILPWNWSPLACSGWKNSSPRTSTRWAAAVWKPSTAACFSRATPEAVARANINLRCAERVLIRLGVFRADSFDALFEGTKALPWESFVGRDGAFPVKGHTVKSRLVSIPDCQRIVKKLSPTAFPRSTALPACPKRVRSTKSSFLSLTTRRR